MRQNARQLLVALAVTTVTPTAALASNPESGTISGAAPRVDWSSSTTAAYVLLNPMANAPEDVPCETPMCDTFALKVEGGGVDMEIGSGEETDDGVFGLRVTDPGGTITYLDSEPGAVVKLKFKKAAAGDWTVDLINNYLGPVDFPAYALLAAPAPAAAPVAAPGAPGTAPPPPQQAPQAVTITVKAPKKASARKLSRSRKLLVGVTVSREVESITGTLKRGSKTVGRGSLGKLSGTGRLTLKLSRLKRGTYTLSTTARTADGVTATRNVKLKVSR